MQVALAVTNRSQEPFVFTGALHSYFNVENVATASVKGLDNIAYVDSIDSAKIKEQVGDISFTEEVDRIYFLPKSEQITSFNQEIHTANNTIHVDAMGSQSVVVWNPWIEKAKKLSQYKDDDYLTMVCVETANAHTDYVTLNTGETHILGFTAYY